MTHLLVDREQRLRERIDALLDDRAALQSRLEAVERARTKYRELAYDRGKSAAMWQERAALLGWDKRGRRTEGHVA